MTHDLTVFLFTAAMGASLSLVYDLMRAIHSYCKDKNAVVAITDIIYWIFVSCLLIYGIEYINNGVIRWYEFAGMILGIGIYKLSISGIIYCILCTVTGFIIKIAEYIFKFCLTAGHFLYKIIMVPLFGGCKRSNYGIRKLSGDKNGRAKG